MSRTLWKVDPAHSRIGFSVRHGGVAALHGRFGRWSARLLVDEESPSLSSIEVLVEAASVDTGDLARDEHLRSGDFLDVVDHPAIEFRSLAVKAAPGGGFRVPGVLAVRGVARGIVVNIERGGRAPEPGGGERVGFHVRAELDRRAFGVTWNRPIEGGGEMIGDTVEIDIDIEAVKPAAQAELRV